MIDEKNSTSNSKIDNLYSSKTTISSGTSREIKVTKTCSKGKGTCQAGEIHSRP
jgi:hypothetical protein